MPFLQCTSGVQ